MKKMISVFVAILFIAWQTTSVGAYGDHDEGTMGYPNSITYKLDNGISGYLTDAFATTWTSLPTGTDAYVSAEFFWEDLSRSTSGSITLADGHVGAVTVSPPSVDGISIDYYSVSSYHLVGYNGGVYTKNLFTFVP